MQGPEESALVRRHVRAASDVGVAAAMDMGEGEELGRNQSEESVADGEDQHGRRQHEKLPPCAWRLRTASEHADSTADQYTSAHAARAA